jgi:hypothetical protein
MKNPFVFIVGCPRSGTTLLRHLVGAHPQIAITPEAHWIAKWFEKRRGLTQDGRVSPAMVDELLSHPKFAMFYLGRPELEEMLGPGEPPTYADFLSAVFDRYGQNLGKQLVGNKTPDAVRKLDTLHALWPAARFVHLIRDGRDVALSFFNWKSVLLKKPGTFATWQEDRAITAALWWDLNVRRGRDAATILGPELYYEMRYESLVRHPEQECAALCRFLGVSFQPCMLRFHEAQSSAPAQLEPRHGWRPISPSARNWRNEMAADEVQRFEAAAGGLLAELGYPRAYPELSPAAVQHSVRIRDRLLAESPDVRPYVLDRLQPA